MLLALGERYIANMVTLIRLRTVLDRTGLSRSMLYELLGRGSFPRPVKLTGARINAWSEEEIQQWIEERLADRLNA